MKMKKWSESREKQAKMRKKMMSMVEEANALREEADQKMYRVPSAYVLLSSFDDVKVYIGCVAVLIVLLVWAQVIEYCLERDILAPLIASFCIALVVYAAVTVYRRKYNKSDKAKIKSYAVCPARYDALSTELQRLKDGIAEYDREYEERKEYIKKFQKATIEVANLGGTLHLTMKARNFHADLSVATAMDSVNSRLEIDRNGYDRLQKILALFDKKTV